MFLFLDSSWGCSDLFIWTPRLGTTGSGYKMLKHREKTISQSPRRVLKLPEDIHHSRNIQFTTNGATLHTFTSLNQQMYGTFVVD